MKKDIYKNENLRLLATNSALLAMTVYRNSLKTRLLTTDAVITGLKRVNKSKDTYLISKDNNFEKENHNMKHFLSALTVVAAAGAVLGAAGYYVYKKTQEAKNYDELLYTEEMGEDFVIVEDDEMEKIVETAADVKDTVVSAAENIKETVSDAFVDVKEAIESVIEE